MDRRKGLTLIELLVVIVVLGALAAIAIPRLSQSATTAKTRACQTNIDTINTQVELYFADNEGWPSALTGVTGDPNYFPDGAPACPSGGTYDFYGTEHRVECSVHGH